jgi:hypothetical protein
LSPFYKGGGWKGRFKRGNGRDIQEGRSKVARLNDLCFNLKNCVIRNNDTSTGRKI